MRRRAFIAALGGAAAWPLVALTGATAAKSFTIAYLALLPDEDRMSFMARFMRRLAELGYNDGQNLRLVYRSAEGQPDILPRRASELVAMKPDVLVTGFGTVAARAGKAAANGIPVVFMAVGDPVGAGIVESLARPGANVTGLSDLAANIQGHRFQLLREIVPGASLVAVVLNPGTPYTALAYKELEAAAKVAKVDLRAFEVRSPQEIAPQMEATKAAGADALAILEDPLTLNSAEGDSGTSLSPAATRCLRLSGVRRGRRSYVLRDRSRRPMAAGRGDGGPSSQRREARRYTGRATDQVRARHQSQGCEGDRPRNSALAARPRRRGDRVKPKHPAGPAMTLGKRSYPAAASFSPATWTGRMLCILEGQRHQSSL